MGKGFQGMAFSVQSTSPSPAVANARLRPKKNEGPEGGRSFHEAVEPLLWLATITRSDTANSVREVARHACAHLWEHWNAARRILKCLKYT